MTTETITAPPDATSHPQRIRQTYTLYALALAFTTLCASISWLADINKPLGATATAAAVIAALYVLLRNQAARAWAILLAYAGLTGLALGSAFMRDVVGAGDGRSALIAGVMAATAAVVLPAYIRKTKADYSHINGRLLIALLALMFAGAVLQDPTALLAVAAGTTLVFAGFIIYDASRLEHGHEINPVLVALTLHINVIALFCQVLNPH